MRLIGIDCGLAALGLADVRLDVGRPRVHRIRLIRTAPDHGAKRKLDDLNGRMRSIATQVYDFLEGDAVLALCIEAKSIPFRDGRMFIRPTNLSALGRVRGLFDAIACHRSIPIIEETAQTLKRLTAGKQTATKDDVIAAVYRRFPELEDLWPKNRSDHEHVADAVAACVAGLEHNVVAAARKGVG